MTSARASRHRPPTGSAGPTLTVREPGELLAAVAAQLGFHPDDSLVLVGTTGKLVELTLRVDLPPPRDTPVVCRAAADALTTGQPSGAVVLVVGGGPGPGAGGDPPRGDVAAGAAAELERLGVEVRTVLWAAGTTAGAAWACYPPCGCRGTVPDPAATPVAAAAVAAGRVVRPSRDALREDVRPPDPDRVRRRSALLDRRPAAAGAEVATHLAVLDDALAATERGTPDLDDETVLALAVALQYPPVRGAALQRCVGPRAHVAEQLWGALAREMPDPEAAEPAALLAVCALARGDGALANVAVDRALEAWPGHHFATTLAAAVAAGTSPEGIRDWLAAAAEDLGR